MYIFNKFVRITDSELYKFSTKASNFDWFSDGGMPLIWKTTLRYTMINKTIKVVFIADPQGITLKQIKKLHIEMFCGCPIGELQVLSKVKEIENLKTPIKYDDLLTIGFQTIT